MRCYILIRKKSETNNLHYYSVSKNNSEEINYDIALDALHKKIFFYKKDKLQQALCIYDILTKKFDIQDFELYPLIDIRVIIKASKAILNNNFPLSISWEG